MTRSNSLPSKYSSLAEQLAGLLPGPAERLLVIKALPDEQFLRVLAALQQALPEASITSLVSAEARGAEEEAGEVLRPAMGKRALRRRLRAGFDVCIIAASPAGAGGWRRLVSDSIAVFCGARLKLLCSPAGVFAHQGRRSILFSPLFSALRLAASFTSTVLWAVIGTLLLAGGVIAGEFIWRALRFLRLVSLSEDGNDRILLVEACSRHGLERGKAFLRQRFPGADIQTSLQPSGLASALFPRVNIERPAVAAVAVDESSGDYFTAAVFALRLRGGRKAVCLADEGAKFLRLSWRYVLRIMLRRGGDWLRRRGRGFIRLFKRAGLASAEDLILHRLTSPPRPAETGNPRVLIVTEGDGVSQRYRCEHKAEQLRLLGWPVRFRRASQYESSFSQLISDAGWADMVIFHRVPPRGTIERLIEHFHRTRRPAVFDIDDWVFEAEALDYIAWSRPEPLDGVISANAFLLERCSHAIGASMPLVERLRARGKPAWLLINNVSLEWLNLAERARRFRQPQEGTLLAYSSGTPSHDRDFEQIVPALLRVMQAMPSVRLRIAGLLEVPEEMSRFADRVEQIGFVPWRKIPYILGDVDLNLAPLEMGNPFAESKSELKYLEAGTLGLPTIASPTPAYRTAIAHGKTGLLAMGAEEWAEALLGCVESPGRRQELGENARRHVMEVYHPRAAAGRLAAVLSEILS